jgi:hypothetical protein
MDCQRLNVIRLNGRDSEDKFEMSYRPLQTQFVECSDTAGGRGRW